MLRCQFLRHVLKALFFIKIALNQITLFLQKNAKFFFKISPSDGWGLCLQTPKIAPPLRISGYAPDWRAHVKLLDLLSNRIIKFF